MNKRPIRMMGLLLCLLLGLAAAPSCAQVQSTIRVYLRRLEVEDTLHIDVKGDYMLDGGAMAFQDGASLTVVLRGDQLVLHTGKMAVVMGPEIVLRRVQSEAPSGLYLNGNAGLYEGDLHLTAKDGMIRPILHIGVEDYLLGVLPYEMGDSFPLEALKAQAVAARTYALRKSGSSGEYDVEDTTNDQAYRGRTTNSPISEQAVKETNGLVGVFRGNLAQCYYFASNGGQTELRQHVWPTSDPDAYGYMDMRDDPYDFENPASVVKRSTIPKKVPEEGLSPALHSALVAGMADQLRALGTEPLDELVRFDEIQNVEAITPRHEGDSRLMTELRFTVKISTRECTFRAPTPVPPSTVSAPSASLLPEGVTPTPEPTPSLTPQPTATPAYSPFMMVEQPVTVTLPYFTTAEQAMGLSINISKNELVTVYDIGSAFMIESRRFGHGVGMSQRGAEQMAGKHGMTYDQILAFYYPGMGVLHYELEQTPLPALNMEIMATPAPTPSPTPRPTHMPVTADHLEKGTYLAVVSNINADSSLNLRETPSLSADVLKRLYKDQKLIVLSVSADGWAHVKTDVIDGYVRSEYLQTAGE